MLSYPKMLTQNVTNSAGIPPSQVPEDAMPPGFTPDEIAFMRQRALDDAVRTVTGREPVPMAPPAPPVPRPLPLQQQPMVQERVVTVRRNLTVAEMLVVFALACAAVVGFQGGWYLATDLLPRIEVAPKK